MTILSLSKNYRYFVLKTNNFFEEFFTLEDALNAMDKRFVIIEKYIDNYITCQDTKWPLSEFSFINDDNEPFNYSINTWTIHNIETTQKTSSRIKFDITISDPLKRIKTLTRDLEGINNSGHNFHYIELVQMAIEELNHHSRFQSWEQMELEIENNKLKEKIKKLEQEIKELKRKGK